MVEISSLTRAVLRELCMNSRVTITELSEKLGASRPIISRRIESLERELGLHYTLDLDYKALGLGEMVVYYISFKKKPPDSVVEDFLKNSPMVQLAVRTKGDFDLVMFVLASIDEKFAIWDLNVGLALSDYGASVNKSDIDIWNHGVIPMVRETIEGMGEEPIYRKLLLALNDNSRAPIREIAKQLKMNEEIVRYYLNKLVKTDKIRRFTTVMTKPENHVGMIFFIKYTYTKGAVNRIYEKRKIYFRKERELPIYNEYQMVLSLSGSGDELEFAIADSLDHVMDTDRMLRRVFRADSPEIKKATVIKTLKGVLAIRNVNMKDVYRKTEWAPGENYTGD